MIWIKASLAVCVVLLFLFGAGAIGAAEHARSVGAGSGILTDPTRDGPCGVLRMGSDDTYENAYAWDGWVHGPPYYFAFAECFHGQPEVCSLVLDLTQLGWYHGQTCDLLIWNDDQGKPGAVLAIMPEVDPGPIAMWPQISRHVLSFDPPVYPPDPWWGGYCPVAIQWDQPAWYIAADLEPPGTRGCPYTNIPPGIGYDEGWQSVDVVWGPTPALGIGVMAHSLAPAAGPQPLGELTSWGKVKGLYR